MAKTPKLMIGGVAVVLACLAMGAAPKGNKKKHPGLLPAKQVEQVVEVIENAHQILDLVDLTCEDPDKAAMVAEILLVAASKHSEGKIDGRAELEKAMANVTDPGVRNFTHFLAAVASAMQEDHEGVTLHLHAVIAAAQKE